MTQSQHEEFKQLDGVLGLNDELSSRLRPRAVKNTQNNLTKKTKTKSLAVLRPQAKLEKCESIALNDIVLFKMRGSCVWPAQVIAIMGNTAEVRFYGDNTTQKSNMKTNFYKFDCAQDVILHHLRSKKTPMYSKSIREAEIAFGIPLEKSVFNQL